MATKRELLAELKRKEVRFLRLMFTDIMGAIKNVEVPASQFEKALDGEIMFDGSSIKGFSRIEESDMLLKPDLDTFVVFPWRDERGTVAMLICDVYNPDETPFDGCPRITLRRAVADAKSMGYKAMFGPELEFFLFHRDEDHNPTTRTHDSGGYFDLLPVDRGEECRRDITNALEAMGYSVEAAHHEVAPGQHEIDFQYADVLATADRAAVFRLVVKKYARDHNLHATFMPKPIFGENGNGMHVHQSLFKGAKSAFHDPKTEHELSDTMLHYVGGLLKHAKGMCAVTNPLINSYKRMVPGYEAPTNIVWSERNRSPLVRVPARRGSGTRVELRMPDPACNPYLAFAVMLAAGMDGIQNRIDPGPPVNKNIFTMSHREKRRLRIDELPSDLNEAVKAMKKDPLIRATLGDHILNHSVEAKLAVWQEYSATVHPWEVERYLARY